MKIRTLRASFGMLADAGLALKSGLNVFCGPNESGKSTWTSFILAMLFGLDTSERDRSDYIADKNLYLPRSGASMQGAMEVETARGDVTLERFTARPGAPMQGFRAYFTGTGEPVPELTGAGAGEALTGVGRETFVRSACIGRSGLLVGRSPELERRIQSILSSGGEESSYTEAEARLRDWRNKKSRPRTGELPKLTLELSQARARLEHMKGLRERETELVLRVRDLSGEIRALEEHAKKLDDYGRCRSAKALAAARAEAEALSSEEKRLEGALGVNGVLPSLSQVQSLRMRLGRFAAARENRARAENARAEAERQQKSAREACSGFPAFSGMEADAAWEKASQDASDVRALQARAKPSRGFRPYGLLFPFALLAAAAALFVPGLLVPALILAVLSAAAGVFLRVSSGRASGKTAEKEISEILKKYGAQSAGEILDLASRYREARALLRTRDEALKAVEERQSGLEKESSGIESEIKAQAGKLFSAAVGIKDLPDALGGLETELSRLDGLSRRAETARVRFETLRAGGPEPGDPAPEAEEPEGPGREETERSLADARVRLSSAQSGLASARGEMKPFGDPASLEAEEEGLAERIAALTLEDRAVGTAMEALSEAESEIQKRFAPALGVLTGEILSGITDGRYQKAMVDRSFDPLVTEAGRALALDARRLSRGTADQLYLALRLAMCRLALPEKDPPPLILDDALNNFDDQRMARALDWLASEGNRRQILLFSCHTREAAYLEGRKEVNVVRL